MKKKYTKASIETSIVEPILIICTSSSSPSTPDDSDKKLPPNAPFGMDANPYYEAL